jgi:hypothetical protein
MTYKIKKAKSQQYEDYILYGDKERDEEHEAREKLNKIKSRVAKDNYIRKMIKKGIYL